MYIEFLQSLLTECISAVGCQYINLLYYYAYFLFSFLLIIDKAILEYLLKFSS